MGQLGGGQLTIILYVLVLAAIYYFLIILPQRRRIQERRKLIDSLSVNDEVMTAGGIIGTIRDIKEDVVMVQVDENVNLRFSKDAIVSNITKERAAKLT